MRRILMIGLAIAVSLTACSSAKGAGSQATLQREADDYAIGQIEANWHKASSLKDLNLMMSLWADNATLTVGPLTYTGKDQIRQFFATKAGSFKPENHWVSETPAYKIRITINGDNGTLYFECHYVDVGTREVKSVVAANDTVARINGTWLITKSLTGTAILSP